MPKQQSAPAAVPPLREGDRLTREEFHRRYLAMPDLKRAELIEGVVHMPSPVRTDVHGNPHFLIVTWLGNYDLATPGLVGADGATLVLEGDNQFEPDVFLMVEKARGGAELRNDGYVYGAAELAVEVSFSSVSKDRNAKKRAYLATGVREYIQWRTEAGALDWFVLRQGKYEPLAPDDGVLKSEVFPGLWLDPAALLRRDKAAVMAALHRGLASPEHAAFVAKLNAAPA